MPNPRARYPEEFKAEAVQLARSYPEKSIPQLSGELGISDQTLRNWLKQAQRPIAENARVSQPKNARNYVGSVKSGKS